MSDPVWPPELQLTDEEKRYWWYQDEIDAAGRMVRRGVAPRLYTQQLRWTNVAGESNLLTWEPVLTDQRTRIYGLTFSGSLESFSIRLRKTPSTLLVAGANGSDYVRLAALLGQPYTTGANTAPPYQLEGLLLRSGPAPLLFPVDVECRTTESLALELRLDEALVLANTRLVVNVIIHSWGFPGALPEAWEVV